MANKYVLQLRRGIKTTDNNGVVVRNDWSEYKKKEDYMRPQEGELVLEFDNGVPRLKIGDGLKDFEGLPYILNELEIYNLLKNNIYDIATLKDVDTIFQSTSLTLNNATVEETTVCISEDDATVDGSILIINNL